MPNASNVRSRVFPRPSQSVTRRVSLREISRELPASYAAAEIQNMEQDCLFLLQRHLLLGTQWGEVRFPDEWIARSQKGGATINLYNRLGKHASTKSELELGVVTAMRMVLLEFCVPTQCGFKRPKYSAPTTVLTHLSGPWIRLIKFALAQPSVSGGGLLRRASEYPFSRFELQEAYRFRNLQVRGLWRDSILTTDVRSITEGSNRGPVVKMRSAPDRDPYLPLPDALVHEAGRCSTWIINSFTPMLIVAYEALVAHIDSYRAKFGRTYSHSRAASNFLSTYEWNNAKGQPFQGFPFALYMRVGDVEVPWPPCGLQDLQQFALLVQMANFFIVALSSGPRASEILSFTTDCLTESRDGTALANGRTYKIVDPFDGEMRDWPMPQLAVQALQYQSRLSSAISSQYMMRAAPGETPLWRNFYGSGAGAELGSNYNYQLRRYLTKLGLDDLMDSQAFTHHRFRKTIARIVALAQVHAPKILMDIFGHKSIQMTMHYILANPSILSEMRSVRKDLVLIMAKKAIQNATSNGGPAARCIKDAVEDMRLRTSDEYGISNEDELALMLTGQGVYWMQPRPGIICTKLADQVGPCAKGKSQPNPSRCQSDCSFRLEEADNRNQVEQVIGEIINKIERAWAQEDEILAEVWTGQLLANLGRFSDLTERWKDHPIIKASLKTEPGMIKNAAS